MLYLHVMKFIDFCHIVLTHGGLVMPYGDKCLVHHWFNNGLLPIQLQGITRWLPGQLGTWDAGPWPWALENPIGPLSTFTWGHNGHPKIGEVVTYSYGGTLQNWFSVFENSHGESPGTLTKSVCIPEPALIYCQQDSKVWTSMKYADCLLSEFTWKFHLQNFSHFVQRSMNYTLL